MESFPRNEGRWSRLFLVQTLLLFGAVTLLEILADKVSLTALSIPPSPALFREVGLVTLMGNVFIMSLGICAGLVQDWFFQHRRAQEIQIKQVQTELDLLKSRIHPHFLFNVLNSIFYMAQKNQDEETAEAISSLSQMMRYMLQEVSSESVPLAAELDYLENFVAMQRMRWTDAIPIEFQIVGDPGTQTLPPMIFLPFVENAFKHGISNAQPTPIRIQVFIQPTSIRLCVENHIHQPIDQEKGGFGLKNAGRRLQLLYPKQHLLQISSDAGLFRVDLTLFSETMATKTPLANTLPARGFS